MQIKLIPKNINNLIELREWFDKAVLDTDTVIGVRRDCKITKIREFTYGGVPIYYNF
jgi:hypothetical protein